MNLYLIHEIGKRNTVGSLIVRAEDPAAALNIAQSMFAYKKAIENGNIIIVPLNTKGLPGILHTLNY